ncbi:hypothetical protein ACMWP9_37480, partial [Escherichia coli]
LAANALQQLRNRSVILPAVSVIDRICAEGISRANKKIYRTLTEPLSDIHRRSLDALLTNRPGTGVTMLS